MCAEKRQEMQSLLRYIFIKGYWKKGIKSLHEEKIFYFFSPKESRQ